MKKEFVFLSGLPRTASTTLSAVLSQNPDIYGGPNSPVCQLMWDTQVSCSTGANEQLLTSDRINFQDELISEIPHLYYKKETSPIVIDKCRSWTLPYNLEMIKRYINPNPKIIVMTRPLQEIIDSFFNLSKRNGKVLDKHELLLSNSEPIMRSQSGVSWAENNNNGEFLFVSYKEFIGEPLLTLERIYEFCRWDNFKHDFNNVMNLYPENDDFYGLKGFHLARPIADTA